MLKLIFSLLLGLTVLNPAAWPEVEKIDQTTDDQPWYYVGFKSTEALVNFSHWVEIESGRSPRQQRSLDQIENQLLYLFGPLGHADFPAVPKTDHHIQVTRTEEVRPGTYKIYYDYEGHFVIRTNQRKTMEVILPNNPDLIYETGMFRGRNRCTDYHYQSEEDFWYFWYPHYEDCPMQEGRDYTTVTANLLRFPNTKVSYPEYERLPNKEGILEISIFYGMDEPTLQPNPLKSKDANAPNYRSTRESLLALGFKSVYLHQTNDYYLEAFEKDYQRSAELKKIRVKTYFGPTGIQERSLAFHQLLKFSLENDAMMIYDGHSGLGGHLDLDSIEASLETTIQVPLDRYQIYFFNSCSSYPYYNSQYFARKRTESDQQGSKNLDIMTNGLSTYFHTLANSNFAVLSALDQYASSGKRRSYQQLAKEIDSDNLFGVNGDEDNPSE